VDYWQDRNFPPFLFACSRKARARLVNFGNSEDSAYIFGERYRLLLENRSHILLRTLHTIMFIGLEMDRKQAKMFYRIPLDKLLYNSKATPTN
jgi:hypothetical protein